MLYWIVRRRLRVGDCAFVVEPDDYHIHIIRVGGIVRVDNTWSYNIITDRYPGKILSNLFNNLLKSLKIYLFFLDIIILERE